MIWQRDWRDEVWSRLSEPWDLLVIGGGITGAGIFNEAVRRGLRALLIEQRDFAWGTSSRSSKLVHGGLRYLRTGEVRLMRTAVRERERLLAEAPGLISPLGFLLPTYEGKRPGRWTYGIGLSLYELLAGRWAYAYHQAPEFAALVPNVGREGLAGGFRYGDAVTDDARLVLRLIREAAAEGGTALNYVSAEGLIREEGRVVGARLRDLEGERAAQVHARVVVNATGAWADRLRVQIGGAPQLRPLRGSHLIFPSWRLPAAQAFAFPHPVDRRPIYVMPWEGVTLIGTTDLDHDRPLDEEPRITPAEVAYLMAAVDAAFPSRSLTLADVLSTFAGVRPVISRGQAAPSRESRDHAIWVEDGLLTVTGGKLTTFRPTALEALSAVRDRLPTMAEPEEDRPILRPVDASAPPLDRLEPSLRLRLLGRYGADAPALVRAAGPDELNPVPGTIVLWAELRWAARAEGVVHLDDLLLRRVRLGLLLPEGGRALLPEIRAICQPELGWDDARWEAETADYLRLWRESYSLPKGEIPEWRARISPPRQAEESPAAEQPWLTGRRALGIGGLTLAGALLLHQRDRTPR